jgi:BirA family biotin operon repressor/biotin-[acetyl-CoA-carboxylase] ligase
VTDAAVQRWTERLCGERSPEGALRRVHVLAETGSTQDAARELGAGPGDAVVALRQSAGRGRLGRRWADTEDAGIAVTFACVAESGQRLAVAGAVAAAEAAGGWLGPAAVGVKWPNDVVVGNRKLAGVLVEQGGGVALVGVGLNVNQLTWPPPLAERAISLREARVAGGGADAAIPRLDVASALLHAADAVLALSPERLADRFRALDVLTGRLVRLRVADRGRWRELRGRLVGLDPAAGMALQVEAGGPTIRLPAETTSVLAVEGWDELSKGRGSS